MHGFNQIQHLKRMASPSPDDLSRVVELLLLLKTLPQVAIYWRRRWPRAVRTHELANKLLRVVPITAVDISDRPRVGCFGKKTQISSKCSIPVQVVFSIIES